MSHSECTTQSVRITVNSQFVTKRTHADTEQYVYAYQVQIKNEGAGPVKLLSRHWVITDEDKVIEEVSGPGVVGEQPLLQAGEAFSYTSGCILRTPGGVMEGCYEMLQPGGHTFDARIAPFVLAQAQHLH